MTINLEILKCAFIYDRKEIVDLKTKELVPKMVTRRRLTRSAKIAVYLASQVSFKKGRIIYGSSFGEIPATANILKSIKEKEGISPTYFQNSVYNTAASYLSMLHNNKDEIITISSGENTAQNILKSGAIKALDGDTILLIATETLDIENIEQINSCIDFLECGVALKVKVTKEDANIQCDLKQNKERLPNSLIDMINIAKNCNENNKNIIEIEI
jgi:hypothetical protein